MHPFHNKSPIFSCLPQPLALVRWQIKGTERFLIKRCISLFISALNIYVDGWRDGWLDGSVRRARALLWRRSVFMYVPVRSLRGLTRTPGHHWGSMKPAHKDRASLLHCLPSFWGLHKNRRCRNTGAVAAGGESRPVKPKGDRCVCVCVYLFINRELEGWFSTHSHGECCSALLGCAHIFKCKAKIITPTGEINQLTSDM